MGTRATIPSEDRMITAFHEAGHVVATIFCDYFDVLDPAVELDLSGIASARAGAKRIRVPVGADEANMSVREFVRIALAGGAATDRLSALSVERGPRIIPGPEGAAIDTDVARRTLESNGMENEFDSLSSDARKLINENWDMVCEIANVLRQSTTGVVSRAQVLSLPTVGLAKNSDKV